MKNSSYKLQVHYVTGQRARRQRKLRITLITDTSACYHYLCASFFSLVILCLGKRKITYKCHPVHFMSHCSSWRKKKRKKQLHLLRNGELFSWSSSQLMFDTMSSGACENLRNVKQKWKFDAGQCMPTSHAAVCYHVWSSRALLLHVLRALTWENEVRLDELCLEKLSITKFKSL